MLVGFFSNNIKACNLNHPIDIKPITILMGENSSGKTSLLQSLSLLTMNKILGNDIKRIKYNNPFHKLGTISEFKNENNNVFLVFIFKDNDNIAYEMVFSYENDKNSNEYGILKLMRFKNNKLKKEKLFYYNNQEYIFNLDGVIEGKENLFSPKIIENSENIQFKTDFKTFQLKYYPKKIEEEVVKSIEKFNILEESINKIFNLLNDGINSIKYISKIQEIITHHNYSNDYIGYNGEKYKEIAKNLKDINFLENVIKKVFDYEIAKIDEDGEFFLNQRFKIEIMENKENNEFYYHQDYFDNKNKLNIIEENNKYFLIENNQKIELTQTSDTIYKYYTNQPLKLSMFGSSINNIIPILTQFAKNREESDKYNITIVEEPEIGLHPEAQAKFIEVLFGEDDYYKTQTTILETHSDHIVNKLRYLVYKGKIAPEDVVIYYKTKESDEFEKIEIDEKGMFKTQRENNEFPQGFFDATLDEMFEIETNAL